MLKDIQLLLQSNLAVTTPSSKCRKGTNACKLCSNCCMSGCSCYHNIRFKKMITINKG